VRLRDAALTHNSWGVTSGGAATFASVSSVGNITQNTGSYVYPGSNSGLANNQTSYYIASNATWGLYTNTSMYFNGGIYQATGQYLYPGSISGYGAGQTSVYWASHSSYGLYTNTGVYTVGPVYLAGYSISAPGGSYGGMSVNSLKNSYYGINMAGSDANATIMYDASGNGGIYYASAGLWASYYLRATNHWSWNTSSDLGYTMNISGSAYMTGDVRLSNIYVRSTDSAASPGLPWIRSNGGYMVINAVSNAYAVYVAWDAGLGLYVGGNGVYAPAFYYNSDIRLKQDLKPIQGLAIIKELNGYKFTWKKDGKHDAGLIAQEVEKVLPEAVTVTESGMKSLNSSALMAPLVESIKELSDKADLQEALILELRKEIDFLKKK
jgi:hypothetical protein